MKERPYQHLPPLEHRPDGSPYRMTPAQRKRANSLISRECCNCDGGNCLALDDGDTCACPQMITFSVCSKWFRWAVLPLDGTLEAEIYRDRDLKRCAVCGGMFVVLLCECEDSGTGRTQTGTSGEDSGVPFFGTRKTPHR